VHQHHWIFPQQAAFIRAQNRHLPHRVDRQKITAVRQPLCLQVDLDKLRGGAAS
jgi:hypothetical protein